ncbi:Hypp3897 [Branchiostoma lanceolatum]|uniref:Hypp3897 protein n=1 Tax=Branchiostoma lanceolatum TaxID=7740 RepID=A0A8K0EZ49_BRALA|nr:Hypp3897 [Branchiostoma lanceolatum]
MTRKALATTAPKDDSTNTDDTANSGNNDPETTHSASGPNEQENMPENVYEDPESLMAIASCMPKTSDSHGPDDQTCPSRGAEGPDCAPKAVSVQKPMTVHELVNIVYGKGGEEVAASSQYINGDDHQEAAAAAYRENDSEKESVHDKSHVIYENTDKDITMHGSAASHVSYENTNNTNGDEAVLYASAQLIYGNEDENAVSAASQSIYRNDNEKPESLVSQIIYGNDNEKAESAASQSIYNNDCEKPESLASQMIYGAGDEKTEAAASCLIYENND